ncbi:cell division protein ZapE [Psychrobium sp. 1_MG-2023]|uniref:cell division protein ZapE n=1 Tax=Psychrobium sp. 1_MG-2023 TaxID=3062624 RepID=UPI00267D89EA|nr:cell division protein ZapE [Psychrobium sp. 1_MG-2023]MDP2560600.1 cell division protein ZapE [Psychrobium sp. 1_MG-2023]
MNSVLLQCYQAKLAEQSLVHDPIQQQAVEQLVLREQALLRNELYQGLYLHGEVGRGKTLLMDMFYDALSIKHKLRLHFHHFMHLIHQRLKAIQGQVNPLDSIASDLANQARVICFDEFFVNDIADAMLLGGIFNALHRHQVMIITTSNTAPDDLYLGGLGRDRFLPTIALIKHHLCYFPLNGELDYRTQFTRYRSVFFESQDNQTSFTEHLARHNVSHVPQQINLCHRPLSIKGRSQRSIWFDFLMLCDGPRSQNDYIELADHYDYLFVSDVIQLGGKVEQHKSVKGIEDGDTNYLITPASDIEVGHLDDCARRFIALVDEFYDRHKLIIIESHCSLTELYQGGRVAKAFLRTQSRLLEMQSIDYQDKMIGYAQDSISLFNVKTASQVMTNGLDESTAIGS